MLNIYYKNNFSISIALQSRIIISKIKNYTFKKVISIVNNKVCIANNKNYFNNNLEN